MKFLTKPRLTTIQRRVKEFSPLACLRKKELREKPTLAEIKFKNILTHLGIG